MQIKNYIKEEKISKILGDFIKKNNNQIPEYTNKKLCCKIINGSENVQNRPVEFIFEKLGQTQAQFLEQFIDLTEAEIEDRIKMIRKKYKKDFRYKHKKKLKK